MPDWKSCILLVEDNEDDAAIAAAALRQHAPAHELFVVRDGSEARDFLNAVGEFADREACNVPDLVLLDMKLPKMGGLEVLRAMRNEPRTNAVPVVVLTASDESADVRSAYVSGANSYIRKPVNFEDFSRAIREITLYWLTVNRLPPKPDEEPARHDRDLS